MRYLAIDEIKDGMLLAKDLFSNEGKVLLAKGTKLTRAYLERLKDFDFTHLYVLDSENDDDREIMGPVSEVTKAQAIKIVKDTLGKALVVQNVDLKQMNMVADIILDEVLENNDVIYNMLDLKEHDNYTYVHSVNVCIISTIMGKHLGLPRDRLKELAMGTLLHDLGMVYIDPEILNKMTNLTPEETKQVQDHARLGFERLRTYTGLSILSAHVAYQHHEREDGSGYPRGLKGDEIHLYAKIAAVADSFDAMTSNKLYREPLWSHEAIAELKANAPTKYDRKAVAALSWSVAPYPVGSVLLLSTGEKAVVVNTNRRKTVVQFLEGKRKNQFLELGKDADLQIEKRLA
ncbi:MAG: HD-GYP domain-containing protein [Firmicutes bacterium]|jgi:HD-GYP domain-containing protein (c-di-GMP phosphodiesterase class II)|nr:HD-GYP domain-containing protein [Bacillota bacterium]